MLKKIFNNLDVPDGEKEDLYVTKNIQKRSQNRKKILKSTISTLKTKKSGAISNNYWEEYT